MLKNVVSVAFSDAVSRGFFFLFNIVVARTITPAEFGVYGLAVSLGVWLWAIADGGLTGHGTRLLAQNANPSRTISAVVCLRLPLLLVIGLLLSLVLVALPLDRHEQLIYLSAVLYVIGMALFPAWVARSHHANKEYVLAYGVVAGVGVLCLGLFLSGWFGQDGLSASLFRNMAWLLGGLLGLVILAKRLDFQLAPEFDWPFLKRSAPLGAAAITYNLLPLVPFAALRVWGGLDALGTYSAMMQVQLILLAGAAVFSSVLMPSVARLTISADRARLRAELMRHFLILGVATIAVCLVYLVAGADLFRVTFGGHYPGVDSLIVPFALAYLISAFRYSFDSILIASEAYSQMTFTGLTALLFSMVGVAAVFKSDLPMAWAYLLAELTLLVLNVRVCRNILKTKHKEIA